jgi:hypothetical protein
MAALAQDLDHGLANQLVVADVMRRVEVGAESVGREEGTGSNRPSPETFRRITWQS